MEIGWRLRTNHLPEYDSFKLATLGRANSKTEKIKQGTSHQTRLIVSSVPRYSQEIAWFHVCQILLDVLALFLKQKNG